DNNLTAQDQGGTTEQTAVSPASPNLVTTASGAVTRSEERRVGKEGGVRSGGYFETGNVTFTLTGPGGFSYTQTDTVNGDGTYTAGDTLRPQALYASDWSSDVCSSGLDNNLTAQDQGGTIEQTVVSPASPNLVTTASGAVT